MIGSMRDPSEWIDRAARLQPRRPFLRGPSARELTYADLRRDTGRFAGALEALGVAAGDRVAAQVEKSAEAVLLYLACLRLGAVLTRGNLASNAAVLCEAWRFTQDDVLLHTLPLFHVHGLFAAINTVLASGASLILLPKFSAPEVLAHLPQASVYMGVPTQGALPDRHDRGEGAECIRRLLGRP